MCMQAEMTSTEHRLSTLPTSMGPEDETILVSHIQSYVSSTSERVQEIAGRAAYESCGFYSVAGLDDPAGGMLGLPSLASLGASLGMESLGFGNPTGTEGQWRCDWCGCSPEATPSRRRGPEGPATLCHACGETFARGERLMLGHHNEASRRGGVAPETAASWHGGWLSVGIPWSAPN